MDPPSKLDQPLLDLLQSVIPSPRHQALRTSVLPSLLHSIGEISHSLRRAQQVSLTGTSNAFDDAQLNVDLSAEDCIQRALRSCPSIVTFSSEEVPVETAVEHDTPSTAGAGKGEESYTVAYDPLDGSSIISANWTVGTIIGIWQGDTALQGSTPRSRLVAAILGVYGPRTTAVVAVYVDETDDKPTCFEVGICAGKDETRSDITLVQERVAYQEEETQIRTRYFAPANLRAASESPEYMALIQQCITQRFTLRYSGGLVPDVVHSLVKGNGLYVSPVTEGSRAKLRSLYELCPVALVIEAAGGRAVDPQTGEDILDTVVSGCDVRAGLICGDATGVAMALTMLRGRLT